MANSSDNVLRLVPGTLIKGRKLGYKIEEPCAAGGSGVVYKATDEARTVVAIKFFLPLYEANLSTFKTASDQEAILTALEDLHKKELECLQHVHHPGIVKVLDHGSYLVGQNELLPPFDKLATLNFFVM